MPPKKDIFKEYLKDGYNPANSTKDDLHRLLNRWFIDTDGAATKANLVDIFNDKIAPHKEDIIQMHAEQKERDEAKKAEEKAAKKDEASSSKTRSAPAQADHQDAIEFLYQGIKSARNESPRSGTTEMTPSQPHVALPMVIKTGTQDENDAPPRDLSTIHDDESSLHARVYVLATIYQLRGRSPTDCIYCGG
ncbi:hypothetical protein CONLIGDRAFT_720036 [Coniochaeta ligniaria NRRL 30616]|uniref:Uncharacterized protein n=1 Tax=Coniochaeta ligniaria NRRL 30616 TaxID=1408157 RepID=A0A1J7I3T4_9PEZI|nr:hypothetical protein CONLIGDRAFT_720036 [Coniochaeta ligniaria NRRL 30616]